MARKIDLSNDIRQITRSILAQTKAIQGNTKSIRTNAQAQMSMSSNIEILAIAQAKQTKAIEKMTRAQQRNTKSSKVNNKQGLFQVKNNRLLANSFATLRSQLLLIAFAGTLYKKTLGDIMKQHSDFEASVLRINQTLKSTGRFTEAASEAMMDVSDSLEIATGVAGTLINEVIGLGLTFTNIPAQSMDRFSEAALDMTAGMNQGQISAEKLKTTTIMLGKALNDPIRNLAALSKNGVTLNESQQDLITSYARFGMLMKAQTVILEEVERQFKDKASLDSYEKTMRDLTTALDNLKKAIGADLSLNIKALADAMAEFVRNTKPDDVYRWTSSLSLAIVGAIGLRKGLARLLIAQAGLSIATKGVWSRMVLWAGSLTTATNAVTLLGGKLKWLNVMVKFLGSKTGIGLAIIGVYTLINWFWKGKGAAEEMGDAVNDLSDDINDIPTNLQDFLAGDIGAGDVEGETATVLDRLKAQIELQEGVVSAAEEKQQALENIANGIKLVYSDSSKAVVEQAKSLKLLSFYLLLVKEGHDANASVPIASRWQDQDSKTVALAASFRGLTEDLKRLNMEFADESFQEWQLNFVRGGLEGLLKEFDDMPEVVKAFEDIAAAIFEIESGGEKATPAKLNNIKKFNSAVDVLQGHFDKIGVNLKDWSGLTKDNQRGLNLILDIMIQMNDALIEKAQLEGIHNLDISKATTNLRETTAVYKEQNAILISLQKSLAKYIDETNKATGEVKEHRYAWKTVMEVMDQTTDKGMTAYIRKLRNANSLIDYQVQTFENQLLPVLLKMKLTSDIVFDGTGKELIDENGLYRMDKVLEQFYEMASLSKAEVQTIRKFAEAWGENADEMVKNIELGKNYAIVAGELEFGAGEEEIKQFAAQFNIALEDVTKGVAALAEKGDTYKAHVLEMPAIFYNKYFKELLESYQAFIDAQPTSIFDKMAKGINVTTPVLKEHIDVIFDMANAWNNVAASMLATQKQRIQNTYEERMEIVNSIKNQAVRDLYEKKAAKEKENAEAALFKKHKQNQISVAMMSGAQGIMNVLMEKAPATMDVVTANIIRIAQIVGVAATTAAQINTIKAQQHYALGGFVSGNRHSRGGVNANLEGGEFVMSREATERFGIEALDQINRGAQSKGGQQVVVNITFTGNVNSSDFVEDEVIPQIRDAIARGTNIGVS